MKDLKYIVETSILGDIEDTLSRGEADIQKSYKIPTEKDFVKNPYASSNQSAFWDISFCIEKYKKQYPRILDHDWKYLEFKLLNIESKTYELYVFFAEKPSLPTRSKRIIGWRATNNKYGYYLKGDIKTCKKIVINLINILANSNTALNELFKYANDNIHKSSNPNLIDDKNLLDLK